MPQPVVTPRRRSRLPSLVVLLACLLVLGGLWLNRYNIYDWFRLRNYRPPAAIVQLSVDTTMTPKAQHLLYINHPSIEDRASFNQNCPNNGGEQTIILGCYHPNEAGIYVFGVSDPQLNGVEQVTTAHETLHAAYQRLTSSQKQSVDTLLAAEFKTVTDQNIIDEMASYKKTEPTAYMDEMHSILGTEDGNITGALATYYKQYFTNQPKIAAFAASYRSAFTSRQTQVAQYDAQLATLKSQIDANNNQLDTESSNLNSQRQTLQNYLSVNDDANYNSQVPIFNSAVTQYNNLVAVTRQQIAQYNFIVSERNSVALQEQTLSQELNSNPSTQAAQ